MATEKFIDEVSSTAASKPQKPIIQQQVQQNKNTLFYGGTPPKKGASRPSGFVKLDENGNEISKPNSGFENDITNDPNFRAAFGNSEFVNDFVSGKTDKHGVTITNVEKGKPVSEGSANVGSGNFEGSSK